MKFITILIVCLAVYSCGKKETVQQKNSEQSNINSQQNTPRNPAQNETKAPPQTTVPAHEPDMPESNSQQLTDSKIQKQEAIRVKFPTGSTQVTLNGGIGGFGENITYVFEVRKGQTLNASVKATDKNGNVRIGQIISPTGKADGPFGNSMTYNLSEGGDWKLVLSENQMSGDPYKGEYELTLNIK